ncbi:Myo-inositol catabolism protein IolB [uncultured spirochete]|jgi:5-deoxy-glucuronate isomerase|uniref:Myo-inositol catabolism protein IolB n=1 Tax=uncultured spirochete TaxID=156406 RepID=A0A3P3XQB1_9SPIR|nr:Myo-inositol catabolism protein IolB [uncultured spirochete]
MLDNPAFENGQKTLCQMNGKNAEMLMNIYVKRCRKGEKIEFLESRNETAILLLRGEVRFSWGDAAATGKRESPFEWKPYCLHFSKNTKASVNALADSEIIVQQTDNAKEFPAVFYTPETCLYQEFGKGQWNGAGHRIVSTMFDLDNAPYSNMVMGEVFNQPGKWSSYPPHHHPQPEVYYYQFDHPEGFGACFIGDNVFKSTDGSFAVITPGNAHQQVVAPGFTMYYVWMIRHLDGDPWDKTRIYVPEYEWLAKAQ